MATTASYASYWNAFLFSLIFVAATVALMITVNLIPYESSGNDVAFALIYVAGLLMEFRRTA